MDHDGADLGSLVVVIPVLDAAVTLSPVLADLAGIRTIVVDGGSRDATVQIAEAAGATVVQSARGRGSQLACGAAAADSEWLMFLHGDTRLGAGWREEVGRFIADPVQRSKAAAFRFRLDATGFWPALLEFGVALRGRVLSLPYGDQGLLIHRSLYDSIGGYRTLPLMEDVDIVRRIGRARLVFLETTAVTSARRYRQGGYLRRPMRNLVCLALYFLGAEMSLIRRIYGA
ncbi:MAG: glycosyltransferase family 2 protein [Alphaproteobacteria bacterium]|nr:glycosyltransferase family 2 protein [Alphaproteobacteria bacterium]